MVVLRSAVPLLFLLAGCKPDLGARQSLVTGERILAVRADPPEAEPKDMVAYSILVVGPNGEITSEPIDWAWCTARKPLSELEPVNPACLAREADFITPLGMGPTATGAVPSLACRLFGPEVPPPQPGEPYGRPVDPDPTGGFYQPLRILVGAGEVAAVASVRIACGLAGASPDNVLDFQKNYVRNKNPEIASLTIPMQVARGSTASLAIAWKETEGYIAYDPSQQKNVPRRESMRVSWFVTDGVLASDRTGRAEDDPATDSAVDYTASEDPGIVRGWAVVRDDRGGIAWQSFTFEVP